MVSAGIGGAPAIYVALELIDGTLMGRAGSFLLRHIGVIQDGVGTLDCVVVPGSGTGLLAGLSGSLAIEVTDGVHHYTLDHTLD